MITDIETVPNKDIGWKPPEDNPDKFPPPFAHKIISMGGMILEITKEKHTAEWLGIFTSDNNKIGEKNIIQDFYLKYQELCLNHKTTIVTFNGRRFDIPVLVARMMHYGIPCKLLLDENFRYQYDMEGHIDLLDHISNFGATTPSKLIHICRAIGMPGKVDIDGSDIQRLYNKNKIDLINSHCMCDIIQTGILLLRYLRILESIDEKIYNELTEQIINLAKEKEDDMLNKAIDLMDSDTLFLPVTINDKENIEEIPF
jgi:predicted PolB exonuclease-like 3'-5' exonuclease